MTGAKGAKSWIDYDQESYNVNKMYFYSQLVHEWSTPNVIASACFVS